MASKPENPPAFPIQEQRAFDGAGLVEGHPGMTLRDWYAGQALAGLCSNPQVVDGNCTTEGWKSQRDYAVFLAGSLAGAMLAARGDA